MAETVTFQPEQTGQEAPPQEQTQQQQGDRPAWLPADFTGTVDEYVASLTKSRDDTKAELTRLQQSIKKPQEQTKPQTQQPTKTAEGAALEVKDGETEDEVSETLSPEAIAPYQQEFAETGDVSEEGRAKIAEGLKGIFGDAARSVVDEYVEGAKGRLQNTTTQLKALAGGDEGYASLMSWASENLTTAEKDAFNRAVNSGDFHAASFAVQGLVAKHQQVNGRAPHLLTGDNSISSDGGFKSLHEFKTAIADPRYKTDPDYRKSVEAKAAKSNL